MRILGTVGAVNLLAFIGMAPFFLQRVHHHWIVPAFSGLLLMEALALAAILEPWVEKALAAVLGWTALMGAVLFWRQFSMFQCFEGCGRKLELGLVFLTASCALAERRLETPWQKKTAALLIRLLTLWFLAALWRGHAATKLL